MRRLPKYNVKVNRIENRGDIENRVHADLQAAGVLATVWGKRIIEAARIGVGFTDAESNLAANWVTCACGELTHNIQVDSIGKPLDGYLAKFGAKFGNAVTANQPWNAARYLCKIEARAVELTNHQQHGITQEESTGESTV